MPEQDRFAIEGWATAAGEHAATAISLVGSVTMGIASFISGVPVLALGIPGIYLPGLVYTKAMQSLNQRVTDGTHNAHVLVSRSTGLELQHLATGEIGEVFRVLSARNIRARITYDATSNDLETAVQDPEYQTVCVVGHGRSYSWAAKDRTVTTCDIERWMRGMPRKRGQFIQWTCNTNEGQLLGEPVVTYGQIYGFPGLHSVAETLRGYASASAGLVKLVPRD